MRLLDYVGTVSFAMSGAATAGMRGMNLLGCLFVGVLAATGGGTLRDLLLGQTPVFWLVEVSAEGHSSRCGFGVCLKLRADKVVVFYPGAVMKSEETLGFAESNKLECRLWSAGKERTGREGWVKIVLCSF